MHQKKKKIRWKVHKPESVWVSLTHLVYISLELRLLGATPGKICCDRSAVGCKNEPSNQFLGAAAQGSTL